MKPFNQFLLLISFLYFSLNGCKSKQGNIEDLKVILENQKDKSTVQLGVEGSDITELYFLRNDAMHPRLLYIKTGNDEQVEMFRKFWTVNNFSTTYHKDNGVFMVRYKNSIDSAVLFSKYYFFSKA